ncbi:uncharacterized protein LOC131650776 [Vicia villosa]|uniref:uncharacterized protein LOC131650776 n=1 Tax=Vicia villosa TaxID=3911 RepID=UPI00273B31AA|nr:uncharacterized protein LOC131650776 [Vicia villosa]
MLRGEKPRVIWRILMYANRARPRSMFTLWMVCQNRLPTKDRLTRFEITTDGKCVYCGQMETYNHMFFYSAKTKRIWRQILNWMKIRHSPGEWTDEMIWFCQQTKGKSSRDRLLKLAATEMIYAVWSHRNKIVFQQGKIEDLRSKDDH